MTEKKASKKKKETGKTEKKKSSKVQIKELTEQLEKLNKQLAEANDKYLRVVAEFDNFKKRKEKEFHALLNNANREVFLELLPVIDDFERSLNTENKKQTLKSLREGVELIYKKLIQTLEKFGLKPIESLDHPFDPELHDALMQAEVKDKDSNIVVEEVEKGYMLKENVLRHAKVIVNK
ncbi:nucleotide exchange factor GrpE [candidate division KSB1 bacterium 4484_87]|nr:MAG: nucleotide exchange factor GrpE [candidate division KSB1 bacterium 4484_87]